MTDAELARRARDGQRTAQEQLVRRWSPRVLAVCHARVGRCDVAEDLTQETLLRGLTHLDTLQDPEKVGAWLRGIAVRVCLDWLRARSNQHVPLSTGATGALIPSDDNSPPAEKLEQSERDEHLLAEIDALTEELREPLLLFYYDGVTYDQIAELLGVSRATVNARLSKARAVLTRRLDHLVR